MTDEESDKKNQDRPEPDKDLDDRKNIINDRPDVKQ